MIAGSRKLPIQHLSIRVPWHDDGWWQAAAVRYCSGQSAASPQQSPSGQQNPLAQWPLWHSPGSWQEEPLTRVGMQTLLRQ